MNDEYRHVAPLIWLEQHGWEAVACLGALAAEARTYRAAVQASGAIIHAAYGWRLDDAIGAAEALLAGVPPGNRGPVNNTVEPDAPVIESPQCTTLWDSAASEVPQ